MMMSFSWCFPFSKLLGVFVGRKEGRKEGRALFEDAAGTTSGTYLHLLKEQMQSRKQKEEWVDRHKQAIEFTSGPCDNFGDSSS
jgi:hypothetical protein